MSHLSRLRRPAGLIGLGAAVTLAAGLGLTVDPASFFATDRSATVCGPEAGGTVCVFENAPARLGPEPVRVADKPHDYYPLLTEIRFVDADGLAWTAPRDTLTDGASIPDLFLPLFGDRRSVEFLSAAALHDAYCGAGNAHLATFHARGWEDTHRMLYDSLLANGTPETKAKIMFAAVYLGGPRWDDPTRALDGVSEADLLREMIWCIWFIETKDPSRAEIEAWMKAREPALLAGEPLTPTAV